MSATTGSDVRHALALAFEFELDGQASFDGWTRVEGLTAQYRTEQYWEGGNNVMAHTIPLGMSYSNLRLTRLVGPASKAIVAWFTTLGADRGERHTAVLRACDSSGAVIAAWDLRGVRAVSWTGPELDVNGPAPATETYEFSYEEIV